MLGSLIGAISSTGCADDQTAGTAVSEAARSLGIESFSISETDTGVVIDGVGADGTSIGQIDLRVGTFVMDPNIDDRGVVVGRQLKISVAGQELVHESEGLAGLDLPAPWAGELAALAGDPTVAGVLARWDIRIAGAVGKPAQVSETPYACNAPNQMYHMQSGPNTGAFTCTFVPTGNCGTNTCIAFNSFPNESGEFRCCWGSVQAVERRCMWPGATTSCGLAGSGGCAVCWNGAIKSSTCATSAGPQGTYAQIDWCGRTY